MTGIQSIVRTLPTVEENLALDEALLLLAEEGKAPETLRLWEARSPFVVLGRSSRYQDEVNLESAKSLSAPIFRRISGGASVVAAQGCMFYSLVLDVRQRPALRMLDQAHEFVMAELTEAIRPLVPSIRFDGTCDLVIGDRKVSGNAVRIGRDWLLYHGTLLLNMDPQIVDSLLKHPPREPDYRRGRPHSEFVCNLGVTQEALTQQLVDTFQATNELNWTPDIKKRCEELVEQRYMKPDWNFQR